MCVCKLPQKWTVYFHIMLPLLFLPPSRLRDLSAEDKLEHQRVKKDFEKNATELNLIKEQKEKLAQELQVGGVM